MSHPLISIILPIRSPAGSTARAIASIQAQTVTDWELLAVLDQADAVCVEAVQAAAAEDPRIRVFHTAGQGGLIPALNLGFEQARGALLARMDADDTCAPERLELQARALEQHPDWDACACGVDIPNRSSGNEGMQAYVDWVNRLRSPEDHFRERFIESPLVHPSVMMRREAWAALDGYRDERWAEDYDAWLRLMDQGGRIGKIENRLYSWTDSPERLTRQHVRYSQAAMLQCKAHFFARLHAKYPVALCGAGPIGKQLVRFLQAEGVGVDAFYEVHPGRIGETIAGVPVRSHDRLASFDGILLSAVGVPGGRDRVRGLVAPMGFVEGENFFCMA